jgi:Transcriptional regulatory protein, C terminal
LLEGGQPVRLGSRAFDILLALLGRPGEVISKEELMASAWPNIFVEEANLRVHIGALLFAKHGDVGLPDLLDVFAGDCPKRHANRFDDTCAARYDFSPEAAVAPGSEGF